MIDKRKSKSVVLLSFILLSVCTLSFAQVKMASIFTDNMVLQQEAKVAIWGWTNQNQSITLKTSWNKQKYQAKADKNGKWKVFVNTPKAGGPYQININDGKDFVLKNVLIGEVWLCSGQSNMEMPLEGWGKIDNYKEFTFQEFYISTYNDLDKKYGFKYEQNFDSIREAKLKKYCH